MSISRKFGKYFLMRLLIFLLFLPAQELGAESKIAINRTAPACKMPQIPLLCDKRILRYTFDATTGNCVILYTNACDSSTLTKHFLTFEECRRDRMQIIRY